MENYRKCQVLNPLQLRIKAPNLQTPQTLVNAPLVDLSLKETEEAVHSKLPTLGSGLAVRSDLSFVLVHGPLFVETTLHESEKLLDFEVGRAHVQQSGVD